MKRALLIGAALALLAPAGAAAKPTKTDKANAARECRAERGDTAATREAFRVKYGTNANGRNAFGKCVSRHARDEERERERAARNASQQCRAERAELGAAAFAEKYATQRPAPKGNPNGNGPPEGKGRPEGKGKSVGAGNAFGKCVSGKAKEMRSSSDERDAERAAARRSAARECAAERTSLGREAFADKYGTNADKRNAFGKCVSGKARG